MRSIFNTVSRAVMKFGDLRAQMDCSRASAMLESFPRDALGRFPGAEFTL